MEEADKQNKVMDVVKKCAVNPNAFRGLDGKYEPLEGSHPQGKYVCYLSTTVRVQSQRSTSR